MTPRPRRCLKRMFPRWYERRVWRNAWKLAPVARRLRDLTGYSWKWDR